MPEKQILIIIWPYTFLNIHFSVEGHNKQYFKTFLFYTVLEVEQFGVELLKPQVSDILTYIQRAIKNIKGHGKKSQAAGKELSILSRYVWEARVPQYDELFVLKILSHH